MSFRVKTVDDAMWTIVAYLGMVVSWATLFPVAREIVRDSNGLLEILAIVLVVFLATVAIIMVTVLTHQRAPIRFLLDERCARRLVKKQRNYVVQPLPSGIREEDIELVSLGSWVFPAIRTPEFTQWCQEMQIAPQGCLVKKMFELPLAPAWQFAFETEEAAALYRLRWQ